jgi:hypothetical protein
MKKATLIILLVLLADQALKVWVKLNFFYDSSISILGDKGYLHFIENRGMAFGMEFGGTWGKLFLTLFRIVAVSAIGYSLVPDDPAWGDPRDGHQRLLDPGRCFGQHHRQYVLRCALQREHPIPEGGDASRPRGIRTACCMALWWTCSTSR